MSEAAPAWSVPVGIILTTLAGIVALYKGYMETRNLKFDAAGKASTGAMTNMEALNDRLEQENLRLTKRVEDLEKAFNSMVGRVRNLEDEIHRLGGTVPEWTNAPKN